MTHRWCASYLTGWFRNSLAWLLGKLYKDEVFPGTMRAACEKPVVEYHRWVRQRDEFVRMFYREVRVFESAFVHSSCPAIPAPPSARPSGTTLLERLRCLAWACRPQDREAILSRAGMARLSQFPLLHVPVIAQTLTITPSAPSRISAGRPPTHSPRLQITSSSGLHPLHLLALALCCF